MAYVGSHHGSMPAYDLYHTPFHTTTESWKRSAVVSEVELTPDNDVSVDSIPRTLPVMSSELDTLAPGPKQHRHEAVMREELKLDSHIGQHHKQQKDQDHYHVTLLTSLNEQTASLLHAYSPSTSMSDPSQNGEDRSNGEGGEDRNIGVLEQTLILGQIALVLASSLPTASAASASSNAECQAQVVVALANMGTVLIRRFDETGDGRELEEAGGLYQLGIGMGMGMRMGRRWRESEMMERTVDFGQKKGKGMGEEVGGGEGGDDGDDDGDGGRVDGVLVLEQLGRLLEERGGRAWKGM